MKRYYTYAYLRKDRTPYYIGKGTGKRAYKKHTNVSRPKERSRIIFLKKNLTEEEAFKHEIYMIAVFGRKDLGTGILHNRTNGGEGSSGGVGIGGRPLKYRNLGPRKMHRVARLTISVLPQLQEVMQQLEENDRDSVDIIASVLGNIQEDIN